MRTLNTPERLLLPLVCFSFSNKKPLLAIAVDFVSYQANDT